MYGEESSNTGVGSGANSNFGHDYNNKNEKSEKSSNRPPFFNGDSTSFLMTLSF
jgi:hypothetical protein